MKQQENNTQDVNIKDEHGLTMLHYAAQKDTNIKEIAELLNDGADQNIQDAYGLTVLHRVIEHEENEKNMLEIVDLLLAKGSDLNKQDNQGMTALHYATWHKKVAVMARLLDNGADPNISTTGGGLTPLHIAAITNQADAAELLLKHKANFYAKDHKGLTAYEWLAVANHSYAVLSTFNVWHKVD